jgi:glutamate 5-kinase
MNPTRQPHLAAVSSMVVKLGTQLLAGQDGRLDAKLLGHIARQIAELRARDIRITLVSSGAIACGMGELHLKKRPTDLPRLQAIAAVGQRRLMDHWADAFEPLNLRVAQILITRHDIDQRARFLNLRNTLAAIHELGVIPIINENDTVSTDELVSITFGDNDLLAAAVTHALPANLLVLLSVVDGILDADGKPVRIVSNIDQARQLVRTEKTKLGKGGMDSKLSAAKMVTDAGDLMALADGRMDDVLPRLLDGQEIGTLFLPAQADSRKRVGRGRWIGSVRPTGKIVVDAGARKALVENGKSLLPPGIVAVQGSFDRGDIVAIVTPDGSPIGRGLANFSSSDIDRIRGKSTSQIRQILAEAAYDEVIHRDNLILD